MPADATQSLEGLCILVVDDQPDARELLSLVLEQRGAVVLAAASAAEAFEVLRAQRPDVVVSDIGLPGEDGYSLARRIRALSAEEGGATPAVALTAYTRSEDRARAQQAGFTHHVSKPVETRELFDALRSAAGRDTPSADG